MRIVLINHYAGSLHHGMEYRPYYFAREWRKLGHEVAIIAATHSHVRTRQPPAHGWWNGETIDDIPYVWLKTPGYRGNGFGRMFNMLAFIGLLYRYSARIRREFRPDLVIASSTYPLDTYPAFRLGRRCGAKNIYEVHDLWPLSPVELGSMSPSHPFIRMMQRAENHGYRYADMVVSMLPLAKEHMMRHGMTEQKFVHIPNGVDPGEWDAPALELPRRHIEELFEARRKGHFLVCYAGAHGLANGLDAFLEAADLLRDRAITFLLVGDGPEKPRLKAVAERRALNNIRFLDPISKRCMPSLLRLMDTLYIGLKRTPLFRFGISPNKLMDYMMAAKPVIQAIEAGNDLVRESGCGLSVAPENPQAIADAIIALSLKSDSERLQIGNRGRQYIMEHNKYPHLAMRFLSSLGITDTDSVKSADPRLRQYE